MSHWDLDTTRTRPDVTKTHPNAVIGPIPAELGMVISLCSGCARSFVEREKRCESDNNVVFLRYTATERLIDGYQSQPYEYSTRKDPILWAP